LHFWYDAQNRPAIVQFNGTKYAYIQNLQGDIVGIVDSNGTEVVKYTYDAWGKVLSTTGSLAATLGTIQPFRYRGYVYDVDHEGTGPAVHAQ
jgi:YD repeat-containing protein